MKNTLTLALAFVLLTAGSVMAQTDAEVQALNLYVSKLKGDLTRKRDSSLTYMIKLEGEQSKAFRKIVREYDKDAKKIGKARMTMLREFVRTSDSLSAEQASELAERAFTIAESRIALRRQYFKLISEEISAVVAVQFLQLQSQFDTMADSKLAATIPLAGS